MAYAFGVLAKYTNALTLPPYVEDSNSKPIESNYWSQNFPVEPYLPVNNNPPYDYDQNTPIFRDKNKEPMLNVQDTVELAYMHLDDNFSVEDIKTFRR